MTAKELITELQALTTEQQEKPVTCFIDGEEVVIQGATYFEGFVSLNYEI